MGAAGAPPSGAAAGASAGGGAGAAPGLDCAGTPGGGAREDHCGVCDADPQSDCFTLFISSSPQPANRQVAGFDDVCGRLAEAAGLEGTFKALLQGDVTTLADRVTVLGPVHNTRGELLVNADVDFFTATLQGTIYRESGEAPQDTVAWVGDSVNDSSNSSVSWSGNSAAISGRQALSTSASSWLTGASIGPCDLLRSLYCISQ